MARDIEVIKAEIDSAIQADPELAGIDLELSSSKVSIWRLWRNVVAAAALTLESLFDRHKSEVAVLSESLIYGKPDWYQAKAFEYQAGDTLIVDSTGKLRYVTVIPANQIIKRCSIGESLSKVTLKVSKLSAGIPEPLTTPEKTAFEYYLDRVKPAGIKTEVISLAGDLLWPTVKVYYRGELSASALRTAIIAAVNEYVATIDFNGRLYLSAFKDAIQAVPGVVDVEMISLKVKTSLDLTFAPISRMHESVSGYYLFSVDHPLTSSDQITLIPV